MAIKLQPSAEPIPGYQLIERIGEGGFGEVWKAEAPGGFLKAIKFVFGSLRSAERSDKVCAEQELKSLNRIKGVRHPYILSLDRFDIVDGRLIIVMELADQSLDDRFLECREAGLPGIPRAELLAYMRESAEALDLMNIQYQLQHLDIKPQNLFLVHHHVKVADFGLVKDLEDMRGEVTSGVTAAYAAPETFDGVISPFCDQYNLAIVYQELLTGRRPFDGKTARQLMLQHLTGEPDLQGLPEGDRAPIARALSKKPEDRFASCSDMVRALMVSESGGQIPVIPIPRAPEKTAVRPALQVVSTPKETVETRSKVGFTDLLEQVAPVPAEEPPEENERGILRPALVLCLGSAGVRVAREFRRMIEDSHGSLAALPHVQLLAVDCDPDLLREASQGSPADRLEPEQLVLARLSRPSYYLKPDRSRPTLEPWMDTRYLCRIPREQTVPGSHRALGRLAFVEHFRAIADRMQEKLDAARSADNLAVAQKSLGLAVRTTSPRVYVVADLGEATGSGMFLDAGYVARHLLRDGHHVPDVVGILLLPPDEKNPDPRRLANTYAALTELNHFASAGESFAAGYHNGPTVRDAGPPFLRCLLMPSPEASTSAGTGARPSALVSDYLLCELTSRLGVEAERRAREAYGDGGKMQLDSVGMYTFYSPGRALIQQAGRETLKSLLSDWLEGNAADVPAEAASWLQEQDRLNPWSVTQVGSRLDALVESALKGPFEDILASLPERIGAGGPDELARQPSALLLLTGFVDEVAGSPPAEDQPEVPSQLAAVLRDGLPDLQVEWEKRLTGLIHDAVEEPRLRLIGAEHTLRQAFDSIQNALVETRERLVPLGQETHQVYQKLLAQVAALQRGGLRWIARSKTRAVEDLLDTARKYLALRYQMLILTHQNLLIEKVQRIRLRLEQELSYCRQELGRVATVTREATPVRATTRPGLALYPWGCRSLEETLQHLMAELTPALRLEVDQAIQERLRAEQKSVFTSCTSASQHVADLARVMYEEAVQYLRDRFGDCDAIQLFLESFPEGEGLAEAFDAAEPHDAVCELAGGTSGSPEKRSTLLAVPAGDWADTFRNQCEQVLPDEKFEVVESEGDIIFLRAEHDIRLGLLPQADEPARAAYEQSQSAGGLTSHARLDVLSWQPLAGD